MEMRFTCPHCGKTLKADTKFAGKKATCPGCKQPFVLQAPPEAVPGDPGAYGVEAEPPPRGSARVPTDEPAAPTPTRPRAGRPSDAGSRPADPDAIDVHEKHRPAVADAAEASRELALWKEELPQVPSAYQPSGKMPAAAVVFMLIGSALGAPAGALAGALVGAIGGGITGLIGLLIGLVMDFCGIVYCLSFVLLGIVGLVAYLLTFAAVGVTSGVVTTAMGRLGKNRNATGAAVFSAASALVGMVLVWVGFAFFGQGPLEAAFGFDPGGLTGWTTLGMLIGILIALFCAVAMAVGWVESAKFCEDCEQFMGEEALPELRLGGLKALARALGERDIDAAVRLLEAPAGKEAKPALFSCAQCGKGYVELNAQYKATWMEKGDSKEKTESWLVRSIELNADEVQRFKLHVISK
jgi:hypothetical protein